MFLAFIFTVLVAKLPAADILPFIDILLQNYIVPLYNLADKFWSSNELPYFIGYEMVFIVNFLLALIFEAVIRIFYKTSQYIFYTTKASLNYPLLVLPIIIGIFAYYYCIVVNPSNYPIDQDYTTGIGILACCIILFLSLISARDGLRYDGNIYISQTSGMGASLEYEDIDDCPRLTIEKNNINDACETHRYVYDEVERVAKTCKKHNVKISYLNTRDIAYTVKIGNNNVFVAYTSGFVKEIGGYKNLLKRVSADIITRSAFRASQFSSILISNLFIHAIVEIKDLEWGNYVKVDEYIGLHRTRSYDEFQFNWSIIIAFLAIIIFAWPIIIAIICQAPIFMLHNYLQRRKAKAVSECMIFPPELVKENIEEVEFTNPVSNLT